MSTVKKIILGLVITLLLVATVGMIGWIGFQEHFRLVAQSLEVEWQQQRHEDEATSLQERLQDHTVIETTHEATLVLENIEGYLTGLEGSGLPVQ